MDTPLETITILLFWLLIQCCLLLVLAVLARIRNFLIDIFITAHTRRGSEQVLRDPIQETREPLSQENAVMQAVQEVSGLQVVVQESLYQRNLSAALVTESMGGIK